MTGCFNKTWLARAAALVSLGAAAGLAHADTPLSLMFSQTLTYESNVLRDNSNRYKDVVSTSGVKMAFDKSYGRQTYKASVQAVANRYKNSEGYDNDGYSANLGLTSSLADDWYVSFQHNRLRQLQPFADQGLERKKEIVESTSTTAFIQHGMGKKWSPNLNVSHSSVNYDVNTFQDHKSSFGRLGLRYSPSDLLYFDAGVAKSHTDNPNYPVLGGFYVGDPVRRSDLDLSSRWVVTGYSSLDARVAWTEEKHPNDRLKNYSGLTGSASWNYTPAGKVSYSLTANRDTNDSGGANDFTRRVAQNRVTTGLTAAADWSMTSKITATAKLKAIRYQEEQRSVSVLQTANGAESLNGIYTEWGMGLSYSPTRYTSFSCDLEVYRRSLSLFSRAYDGESVTCSAALLLNP